MHCFRPQFRIDFRVCGLDRRTEPMPMSLPPACHPQCPVEDLPSRSGKDGHQARSWKFDPCSCTCIVGFSPHVLSLPLFSLSVSFVTQAWFSQAFPAPTPSPPCDGSCLAIVSRKAVSSFFPPRLASPLRVRYRHTLVAQMVEVVLFSRGYPSRLIAR